MSAPDHTKKAHKANDLTTQPKGEGYVFHTQVRVRYAETDQMGYVYYGNYATYLEIARVESLRDLGIRYRDLELEGVMLPVAHLDIRYKAPARYDDLIDIELRIVEIPRTRIVFDYTLRLDGPVGPVISTAQTTLVFVNTQTRKVMECPPKIIEALSAYFPPQ